MINWDEVQALHDKLEEIRGKLAWLVLKDARLQTIRSSTWHDIMARIEELEAYVAPFREATDKPASCTDATDAG